MHFGNLKQLCENIPLFCFIQQQQQHIHGLLLINCGQDTSIYDTSSKYI